MGSVAVAMNTNNVAELFLVEATPTTDNLTFFEGLANLLPVLSVFQHGDWTIALFMIEETRATNSDDVAFVVFFDYWLVIPDQAWESCGCVLRSGLLFPK